MIKLIYKIGIFKIEYKKIKKEKRTITKKILFFIKEEFVNQEELSNTFINLHKIYSDTNFYFCEVKEEEDYFFFPSKNSKMRILKNERGIEQ